MDRRTKRRLIALVMGVAATTIIAIMGTVAFFQPKLPAFVRNALIADAIFIAIYIAWIRLHKGYEDIYRAGLGVDDEQK